MATIKGERGDEKAKENKKEKNMKYNENNIQRNLASMCMKAWSLFFKMDSHLSTDPHLVAEKNHHHLPHHFYRYHHFLFSF